MADNQCYEPLIAIKSQYDWLPSGNGEQFAIENGHFWIRNLDGFMACNHYFDGYLMGD